MQIAFISFYCFSLVFITIRAFKPMTKRIEVLAKDPSTGLEVTEYRVEKHRNFLTIFIQFAIGMVLLFLISLVLMVVTTISQY